MAVARVVSPPLALYTAWVNAWDAGLPSNDLGECAYGGALSSPCLDLYFLGYWEVLFNISLIWLSLHFILLGH